MATDRVHIVTGVFKEFKPHQGYASVMTTSLHPLQRNICLRLQAFQARQVTGTSERPRLTGRHADIRMDDPGLVRKTILMCVVSDSNPRNKAGWRVSSWGVLPTPSAQPAASATDDSCTADIEESA